MSTPHPPRLNDTMSPAVSSPSDAPTTGTLPDALLDQLKAALCDQLG